MPVLIVYGMPKSISPGGAASEMVFEELLDGLRHAIASSLIISTSRVSIFFPTDIIQHGLGEELIFEIKALRAEKDAQITRRSLASAIVSKLSIFALEHLPQCQKVEDIDSFAIWERQG
jgi:hypothetical protein